MPNHGNADGPVLPAMAWLSHGVCRPGHLHPHGCLCLYPAAEVVPWPFSSSGGHQEAGDRRKPNPLHPPCLGVLLAGTPGQVRAEWDPAVLGCGDAHPSSVQRWVWVLSALLCTSPGSKAPPAAATEGDLCVPTRVHAPHAPVPSLPLPPGHVLQLLALGVLLQLGT